MEAEIEMGVETWVDLILQRRMEVISAGGTGMGRVAGEGDQSNSICTVPSKHLNVSRNEGERYNEK